MSDLSVTDWFNLRNCPVLCIQEVDIIDSLDYAIMRLRFQYNGIDHNKQSGTKPNLVAKILATKIGNLLA